MTFLCIAVLECAFAQEWKSVPTTEVELTITVASSTTTLRTSRSPRAVRAQSFSLLQQTPTTRPSACFEWISAPVLLTARPLDCSTWSITQKKSTSTVSMYPIRVEMTRGVIIALHVKITYRSTTGPRLGCCVVASWQSLSWGLRKWRHLWQCTGLTPPPTPTLPAPSAFAPNVMFKRLDHSNQNEICIFLWKWSIIRSFVYLYFFNNSSRYSWFGAAKNGMLKVVDVATKLGCKSWRVTNYCTCARAQR